MSYASCQLTLHRSASASWFTLFLPPAALPPSFFCLFSPWFSQWAAEGSPSNPSNFPLPAFLLNVITAQRIPSIHCPGCHEHMALHNLNSIPFQPQEKYGLGMSVFLLNG